jgi:hypothetical protein
MSHLKQHGISSTADHAPGTNDTVTATEAGAIVEKSFGTAPTSGNLVEYDSNGDVIVPLVPTSLQGAASQQFVLNTAITGTTWKELVLHQNQLINTGAGGISQAMLIALTSAPTAGGTFILTDDGSTTVETWTAVNGASGANQFQVDGGDPLARSDLVARINADSTLWDAVEVTSLDNYFSPAEANQILVYRTVVVDPDAATSADRAYGTATNTVVVEFGTGNQDYRQASGTASALPGADPSSKRFGFGRLESALDQNDTHRVANDNTAFTWDDDDQVWQNTDSGGSAATEGDGIDVTGGKVSVDAATAASAQQYGGIVVNRTSTGGAGPAADAGFIAVQTDDTTLEVNASNQLAIKAGSDLSTFTGFGSWASDIAADKEPTTAELNTHFGAGATGIGNWAFLVEDGTAAGSTSTFMAYKKADGVYHVVEMA